MPFTFWNNKITALCVALRARVAPRHYLIWMTTLEQLRHADYRSVFMLKCAFYRLTRQRIHNTLTVADRYLRLMRDKTICFIPHESQVSIYHIKGVVDSYNLHNGISYIGKTTSLYWIRPLVFTCKRRKSSDWKICINAYYPVGLWFNHYRLAQLYFVHRLLNIQGIVSGVLLTSWYHCCNQYSF